MGPGGKRVRLRLTVKRLCAGGRQALAFQARQLAIRACSCFRSFLATEGFATVHGLSIDTRSATVDELRANEHFHTSNALAVGLVNIAFRVAAGPFGTRRLAQLAEDVRQEDGRRGP